MSPAISVLLTLLYIAFVVRCVLKKVNSVFIFMMSGIAVLMAYSAFTGTSVLGEDTTGNIILDCVVFAKNCFSKNMSGVGLTLMMVTGYAMYMTHIGASTKLAFLATKPLGGIKNPYIVLSFLFLIGCALKLVIPSASGHAMLLMSIAFPIMIALGISPLSACTAVVMGSFLDWGPNDSSAIFAAEKVVGIPMIDYFMQWQLPVGVILSVIAAILLPMWLNHCDKKAAASEGVEGLQHEAVKDSDCPVWYSIFPVAPLVIIIAFAFSPIKMDVTVANLLCLLVVFLVELARKRDKAVTDDMSFVMKEMGGAFARVVSILSAAAIFAEGIKLLGGLTVVSGLLAEANGAPIIVVLCMSFITFFGAFILGSGNASWYAFGPLVPDMCATMGMTTQSIAVPMQLATAMGRSMSPVAGVIIATAGMGGIDLQDLSKSCMIPCIAMFLLNVIIGYGWTLFF